GRLSREDPGGAQPARLRALHSVLPTPRRRADCPPERLPAAGRPAEAVRLAAIPGWGATLSARALQEGGHRRPGGARDRPGVRGAGEVRHCRSVAGRPWLRRPDLLRLLLVHGHGPRPRPPPPVHA